jgi:hypothetical protein
MTLEFTLPQVIAYAQQRGLLESHFGPCGAPEPSVAPQKCADGPRKCLDIVFSSASPWRIDRAYHGDEELVILRLDEERRVCLVEMIGAGRLTRLDHDQPAMVGAMALLESISPEEPRSVRIRFSATAEQTQEVYESRTSERVTVGLHGLDNLTFIELTAQAIKQHAESP